MIEVVAGFIRNDNTVLICQRGAQKARALKWEFPGGKVEANETKAQALARECREELGIVLSVGRELTDVEYEYPDVTVHLTLLDAVIQSGVPAKLEHNDMLWVMPEHFPEYGFCPADQMMIAKLLREE